MGSISIIGAAETPMIAAGVSIKGIRFIKLEIVHLKVQTRRILLRRRVIICLFHIKLK
jgi:hypothetical protein